MKDDIYTILNDASIDLSSYEQEYFNDIEKRKIKKNFRKSINNGKSHKKRNIAAAALVLALTIGIVGTNSEAFAIRVNNIIGIDIGSFLGIQKNIDEYKTVVNKSITNNGITVKLNEVVLNGNELIVSYNVTSDKKLGEAESWDGFNAIYVNGKKLNTGAGGSAKNIDDYTTQSVMNYDLGTTDLSGDLDIKIACSSIGLMGSKFEKKGAWSFEFKTNGNQLKIDTKELALNKKITLENGTQIALTRYTSNALGQKIYASVSNFKIKPAYNVVLKGTDNLGNKVEFYTSHSSKDSALFKIENINGNLNENAKTLVLTPYAAKYPEKSGKMSDEYKEVGDSFTIDLSQLK